MLRIRIVVLLLRDIYQFTFYPKLKLISSLKKIINISDAQFKKYLSSSFWMLFEKVTRLAVNLFVGIWLARYLGPSDFGVLNFGIAIAAIFLPIVHFGLQGILVKELYNFPKKKNDILGTSFALKLCISIVVFSCVVFSSFTDIYTNQVEKEVVVLVAISLLFQPFLVIECWFESQVNAKTPAIIKTIFFFTISIVKIIMIVQEESLMTFGILYSLEVLFVAISLIISYVITDNSLFSWSFNSAVLWDLARKSWLLVFSGLSAVVYLKIDQIMLGSMVSDNELGIYSAAVKISEAWYFIPLIISNALFPAILSAKKRGLKVYFSRLQQLCDTYFIASFLLALTITFSASFIIILLYGKEYSSSALVLQIHIWAGIFIFMRTVLSKWLIAEDKYKYSLISQLSGAIINVLLNLVLIPKLGGVGAAIATIISYCVASFLIFGCFKETRAIFHILVKSIVSPIRILSKI